MAARRADLCLMLMPAPMPIIPISIPVPYTYTCTLYLCLIPVPVPIPIPIRWRVRGCAGGRVAGKGRRDGGSEEGRLGGLTIIIKQLIIHIITSSMISSITIITSITIIDWVAGCVGGRVDACMPARIRARVCVFCA